MKLVTDVQNRILEQLNFYDRMTIKQVNRSMGYRPTNYTTTWSHLKKLKDKGLVDAVDVDLNPGKFSAPTKVFFVSNDGRKYLRSMGIETPERKAIKDAEGDLSMAFWRHALACNDFCISCRLWSKQTPGVTLTGMLTDIDIRRDPSFPVKVTLPNNETGSYKPDSLIELTVNQVPYAFCLELERGIYSRPRWETKVLRMFGFYRVNTEQDYLRFLILATEGKEHIRQLSEVTEQVLTEVKRAEYKHLFLITDTPPEDMKLFTDDCWIIPGSTEPVGLF